MTVGLGFSAPCGHVYLASDTAMMAGYNRKPPGRKIIELSECHAVAVSGMARTAMLIEYHRGRLAKAADQGGIEFSMEYRKMLQDDGYERDDGTPTWSHSDSSVLLASKTGLYLLDSSMHVIRADVGTPYGIGCGGEYAMGAMAAYQQDGITNVSSAMIAACEVAYRFSAGCGGKVDVWRVGRAGEGKFIT